MTATLNHESEVAPAPHLTHVPVEERPALSDGGFPATPPTADEAWIDPVSAEPTDDTDTSYNHLPPPPPAPPTAEAADDGGERLSRRARVSRFIRDVFKINRDTTGYYEGFALSPSNHSVEPVNNGRTFGWQSETPEAVARPLEPGQHPRKIARLDPNGAITRYHTQARPAGDHPNLFASAKSRDEEAPIVFNLPDQSAEDDDEDFAMPSGMGPAPKKKAPASSGAVKAPDFWNPNDSARPAAAPAEADDDDDDFEVALPSGMGGAPKASKAPEVTTNPETDEEIDPGKMLKDFFEKMAREGETSENRELVNLIAAASHLGEDATYKLFQEAHDAVSQNDEDDEESN